jgi:hypothetical protein
MTQKQYLDLTKICTGDVILTGGRNAVIAKSLGG